MTVTAAASLCMKVVIGLLAVASAAASAQSVPTIDTEDATPGTADVGSTGRLHPQIAFDLRNGDFARGDYDDDRADLGRLPVHAQVGVAIDLARAADGRADAWLVLRSSNGFHAANAGEARSPRSWYESNNLVALVVTPVAGLRTAAVYTIKASPNGASDTSHEASLSLAYDGENAIGGMSPTFVMTVRPKGDHGIYTQAGIEPGLALADRDDAIRLSLPIAAGVGWSGFYGPGTRSRTFGSAGAALEQPFRLGTTRWQARAEALVVIRDDRLAALGRPDGESGSVVPLVTLSIAMAY